MTLCGEVVSIAAMPCCSYQSIVAAAGAWPEPFSAITPGWPDFLYRQKQSPPMPVDCGSITHCTAIAAIAASSALPPARSTSSAASVAAGIEVAAMPLLA